MPNRNGNSLREQPVTALVGELAQDTATLVRQEVQLAKAEMNEKIDAVRTDLESRIDFAKTQLPRDVDAVKGELTTKGKEAGIGAGLFAGAAVVGLFVFGLLTALIVTGLDAVMPLAAAIAVTLVIYAALAAGLALLGRGRFRRSAAAPLRVERITDDIRALFEPRGLQDAWPPVPEQTIETLKEDVEWAKHPKTSGVT
jgi:hypothetical protein